MRCAIHTVYAITRRDEPLLDFRANRIALPLYCACTGSGRVTSLLTVGEFCAYVHALRFAPGTFHTIVSYLAPMPTERAMFIASEESEGDGKRTLSTKSEQNMN